MTMKLIVPLLVSVAVVYRNCAIVNALPYGVKDPSLSIDETYFKTLSCNTPMSSCQSWSTWYSSQSTSGMATIPCGTCVKLDVADHSTVTLLNGLNIIGKLDVPSTITNVTLSLPLLLVQGELAITTGQTVISPQNLALKILMTGTNSALSFTPSTTGICSTSCTAGKKGIVVVGGKLTVDGWVDNSCPTWTTILDSTADSSTSTNNFVARPTLPSTCPDPYTSQNFEGGSTGWTASPGATSFTTSTDTPINGKYLKVTGRTDTIHDQF